MTYAYSQQVNNSRPGVCRCSHPRMRHEVPLGRCQWWTGDGGCPCVGFVGPVDVVIKKGSRTFPLVYTRWGRVAHILDSYVSSDSSEPALCAVNPFPYCWRGAGSSRENARVTGLPLCSRCAATYELRYNQPVIEA